MLLGKAKLAVGVLEPLPACGGCIGVAPWVVSAMATVQVQGKGVPAFPSVSSLIRLDLGHVCVPVRAV